jgi:FkbM family methyltransferase
VRNFRTAVDGGAHVGSWSRYLALRFANVAAFEPDRENHACAQENTLWLPNVFVFPYALGAVRGTGALATSTNTGAGYVVPGDDFPIWPLDTFNLQDVDYLKLDLEGYEGQALLGAADTIARCKPVVQIEEKARFRQRYPDPWARDVLAGWGYREVSRHIKDVVFVCD